MPTFNGTTGADTLTGGVDDDTINGLAGDDILNGGGGADLITGGDGDDDITGGDGNDILNGGNGRDTIRGGAGNDTIDSIDRPESLFGAPVPAQRDIVDAGDGDDQVTGGRLDLLDGGTGTDNLSINFGFQSTGPVDIAVLGAFGSVNDGTAFNNFEFLNFTLTDGADRSSTGDIRASIDGGAGNDVITTGAADDVLSGGAGDDILNAGGGNDTLSGGAGNDTINGGAGDDAVTVGRGGQGADRIDLGAGNDTVRVEDNFNIGQIRLTFTSAEVGNGTATDGNAMTNQDGGLAVRFQAEDAAGNLTGDISRFDDEGIQFIAGTQGITFDVRDLVSGAQRGDRFEGVVLGTSGADNLSFFPPFREGQSFYYNAGAGNDTVTGGSAADFLVGGAGDDILNGAGGNDSFIGGGGIDTINGGAGDDIVIHDVATAGADLVNTGEGSDVVNVSGATQVRLTFTSAEVGNGVATDSNTMANQDGGLAVRLQAEDGAGALTGAVSRFDDEMITFVAAAGTTLDVRDLVSGVARGDQFQVATLGSSAADTLTAVFADRSYYINAGQGNDTVIGGSVNDFLVGGAGDDTLAGGLGNDSFLGGVGNDTVFGGAGLDTLNGDDGNDVLVGNENIFANDADILTGGNGDDLLYGETADTLNGGGGYDRLIAVNAFNFTLNMGATSIEYAVLDFGNDVVDAATQTSGVQVFASGGNDAVTGSAFDDVIFGGAGNDTISAGAGNDTLVGEAGIDNLSGGAGDDRIYFDSQDVALGGDGFDAGYVTAGTGISLDLGGASIEFIQDLAGGADTFNGAAASQGVVVVAGAGADTVTGSAFTDSIYGDAGDDVLTGGAGNDLLIGGVGSDRLSGGTGVDRLFGGPSDGVRDTFVFGHTGAANADEVYEFEVAQDRIDLTAFASAPFGSVTVQVVGGDSIVSVNGERVAIFLGVTGLTASNFLFGGSASLADPDAAGALAASDEMAMTMPHLSDDPFAGSAPLSPDWMF